MNKIIKDVLETRQAVKSYRKQKISSKNWKQILETIHWSPSSYGLEPYRVITIKRKSLLRDELLPLMGKQKIAIEADKLVLFVSLQKKAFATKKWVYPIMLKKLQEVNGLEGQTAIDKAKKITDMILKSHLQTDKITSEWSVKQTYIALGMAMYSAAILGIGSTPIEGFDGVQVNKLLKRKKLINADEQVAVMITFGYPLNPQSYAHWGSGKRVRREFSEKFSEII